MDKPGKCFAKGTLLTRGKKSRSTIEKLQLGWRVSTWEAKEWGFEESLLTREPFIDRATYRAVWFSLEGEEGERVDFGMLKPLTWLWESGAFRIGDRVAFDLPEMGVVGSAQVMAIEPCPEIEDGPGRIVMSVYKHYRGQIWEIYVEGESKPIRGTELHPFWSLDRNSWVPLCELTQGEWLSGMNGRVQVLKIQDTGRMEPVYNIEVNGDHCYRVGEQGILVHNASAKLQDFLQPSDAKRTKDYVAPGAALRKASGENLPLFKGYRNLGALYYKLGKDSTTLIRLPASGFVEGSGGKTNHAERKLLMMLPSDGCPVIVELYTERYPCKTCDPILEDFAKMMNSDVDILIYFIAPAGDGTDSKSAQELLNIYDKVFGLRWW